MSLGTINHGKSFNYYFRSAIASGSFQSVADVVFNFRGQEGFRIMLEGTGVVEFSFNGNQTHGRMDSTSSITTALQFDHRRVSGIWFRTISGTPTIQVQAWAAK